MPKRKAAEMATTTKTVKNYFKNSKRRRKAKPTNQLGRTGGAKIPLSATTLSKALSPFIGTMYTTFLYENELTRSSGGTIAVENIACNNLYDIDVGGFYGNKQPLYYDTLLTVSGPYKTYKVLSWKTTYTIVNAGSVPVTIWALPSLSAVADADSAAEADNFPGTQSLYLTGASGSKNHGKLTVLGHVNDVYKGGNQDRDLIGAYNAAPGIVVYGGIVAHTSDGTTALDIYVAVRHEAYTLLEVVDALVS